MKRVAIVGVGPTAVYLFAALAQSRVPLSLTLLEKSAELGSGMPYNGDTTSESMLSNIASFEIPPVFQTLGDWLRGLDEDVLADMQMRRDEITDERFFNRITLGKYYQAQLSTAVSLARSRGHDVVLRRRTEVSDIALAPEGVAISWSSPDDQGDDIFDEVAITTGHSWGEGQARDARFVPLWPLKNIKGLKAKSIGILGTSLSAIDAAMAIADEHGAFHDDGTLVWHPRPDAAPPVITLMSRKGLLPEAYFYYPFPLPDLTHLTEARLDEEIEAGQTGLLDRLFAIFIRDLNALDADFCAAMHSAGDTIEAFAEAYFRVRLASDPFDYARTNLASAKAGHATRQARPLDVAILTGHEMFEEAAPYLNAEDLHRLKTRLGPVFTDNYAAVPHESIERLLALHDAGVLKVAALGEAYSVETTPTGLCFATATARRAFDIVIDARGQNEMSIDSLCFPGLVAGKTVRDLSEGAGLHLTPLVETAGFVQCVSLPALMMRRPFVQGLENCAELGRDAAQAILERAAESGEALATVA